MTRVAAGTPNWGDDLNADLDGIEYKINTHSTKTNNPHGVTKAQVGLGAVDDTSDMDKPVSTAQAAAIKHSIKKAAIYTPNLLYSGPASTDAPTVALGIAGDATFNEAYRPFGTPYWPVDVFGNMVVSGQNWFSTCSITTVATASTYRFMTDANELVIYTATNGFMLDLFIDGQPYANNPITPVASAGLGIYGFQKLTFASAKPRLIELRTVAGLAGLYVKKPYRVWEPPPALGPSIAVVGDSFVTPTVLKDDAAGAPTTGAFLRGIYQRMPAVLGITKMVTDGLGGSGYLAPGGSSAPYSHANRIAWRNGINPDVLIVHGGGANDFYNSYSVEDVTDAAVAYFTQAHIDLPDAKLVFVEGFAPPHAGFSGNNPNYIALRTNVQAALAAAGVPAYFLDVATTRPPISGTGYVTAPTGVGNSDIYVGSDSTHLSIRGNEYVREVLAPKIAKVLADNGALVGSLIY